MRWAQSFGEEQQRQKSRALPSPSEVKRNQDGAVPWNPAPSESHDGRLGDQIPLTDLFVTLLSVAMPRHPCLPFSISLIISRGGHIFSKLPLKGLAPSPHRLSLSVPVGDLSAVTHSPPSKFLPASVICAYGEHMSQAKNKISEGM